MTKNCLLRTTLAISVFLLLKGQIAHAEASPPASDYAAWEAAADYGLWVNKSTYAPFLLRYTQKFAKENPSLSEKEVRDQVMFVKSMIEIEPNKVMETLSDFVGVAPVASFAAPFMKHLTPILLSSYGFDTGKTELAQFSRNLREQNPYFWRDIATASAEDHRIFSISNEISKEYLGISMRSTFDEVARIYPQFASNQELLSLAKKIQAGFGSRDEAKEEARRVLNSINSSLQEVKKDMSENQGDIQSVREWVSVQKMKVENGQKAALIRQRTENAYAAVALAAAALKIAGADSEAQRVIGVANAAVQIGAAISLYSAGALSGVGTAAAVVGGISSIIEMSSDATNDPIMPALRQIQLSIDEMRNEISKNFVFVNSRLNIILQDTSNILNEVISARKDIQSARDEIAEVAVNLDRMQENLVDIMSALYNRQSATGQIFCLSFRETFSADMQFSDYAQCLSYLYASAALFPKDRANMLDGPIDDRAIDDILRQSFPKTVRYLARLSHERFGNSLLDPKEYNYIGNPAEWAAATLGYMKFASDNSNYFKEKTPGGISQLQQIATVGEQTSTALAKLRGPEGEPGQLPPVVNTVIENYEKKIQDFSKRLQGVYDEYVENFVSEQISYRPAGELNPGIAKARLCDSSIVENYMLPGYNVIFTPDNANSAIAVRSEFDTEMSQNIQNTFPSAMLTLGGTSTIGDEPKSRRLSEYSACIKKISVAPSTSRCTLTVDYEFGEIESVVTIRYRASPNYSSFNEKVFDVKVKIPQNVGCMSMDQVMLHWHVLMTNIYVSALTSPFHNEILKSDIKSLILQEPVVRSSAYLHVLSSISSDVAVKNAADELQGARRLLDYYIAAAYPISYRNSDALRLLTSGSTYTRLPDTESIKEILSCLSAEATANCNDPRVSSFALSLYNENIIQAIGRRHYRECKGN